MRNTVGVEVLGRGFAGLAELEPDLAKFQLKKNHAASHATRVSLGAYDF